MTAALVGFGLLFLLAFCGVPLAFAFIATIGAQGILTKLLLNAGIDLRELGVSPTGFWGLVVVYLYFQIPLMLIIMTPAVEGLRQSWREAAAGLGASTFQYWARVGIPLLTPAFIGGVVLLFANSFAAAKSSRAAERASCVMTIWFSSEYRRLSFLARPGSE